MYAWSAVTVLSVGPFLTKSRTVARKPRDTAAVLFVLKYADNIHYKFNSSQLRKPGFSAPISKTEFNAKWLF